jgi:hypothetical protein
MGSGICSVYAGLKMKGMRRTNYDKVYLMILNHLTDFPAWMNVIFSSKLLSGFQPPAPCGNKGDIIRLFDGFGMKMGHFSTTGDGYF